MEAACRKPTCEFCNDRPSKYTCPKCTAAYCSSECYRNEMHGSCAQGFYRECVFERLREMKVDNETKVKTLQMIKRSREMELEEDLQADAEEVSSDEEDLASRLKNVDLDVDEFDEETVKLVLSQLTDEEKQEFENMIKTGDIMNLVPEHEFWKPWWLTFEPKLVEEATPSSKLVRKTKSTSHVPQIHDKIAPLSQLTSKVSDNVCHSVTNIVISFAYVCRYLNGEHHKQAVDAVNELVAISAVFRDNTVFEDSKLSVQSVLQILINEKQVPIDFCSQLVEDCRKIVSRKETTLRMLSDLLAVINEAVRLLKSDQELRRKLKLIEKKVQFLLSWTLACGDALTSTLIDIDLEFIAIKSHEHTSRQPSGKASVIPTRKPIIEELN